jgi:cell cycle arrest protein BUB3
MQSVTLYDGQGGSTRGTYAHMAPVLDCCFQDDTSVAVSGLDGQLKQ